MKWLFVLLLAVSAVYAQDYSGCVSDPFNKSCATYTLPLTEITNGIATACGMMYMTGCSIPTVCNDSSYKLTNDKYCAPFSVYMDVCSMNMTGCNQYYSMCPAGSVIQECNLPRLTLPGTKTMKNNVQAICTDMPGMSGCSECSGNSKCDYLKSYSDLCLSMPDMVINGTAVCADWKTMCEDIPDWPLCSNGKRPHHDVIPEMRMFFHVGFVDYVLFKTWVPYDSWSFAVAWIAIFLFTIVYEVIKLVRTRLEKKWSDSLTEENSYISVNSPGGPGGSGGLSFLNGEAPFRPKVDFTRAFIHTVEVAWGFLVMLVVMTFNVGLCLAVLAGSFIGVLLVGRFVSYVPKASCH